MKKLALTLLLASATGVLARADGLRLDRVPAEAHWLVHVDFDGLKRTELWKILEQHAAVFDLAETWEELDEVEQEFGIHPLRDVFSITVFGQDTEPDEGVVMFHVRGDVQLAIERLRQESDFRELRRDGVDLFQWSDGSDNVMAHVHRISGSDDTLVLLGGDADDLVHAARVLDRGAPNLEGAEGRRMRPLSPAGSIVYVAAEGGIPGLDAVEPASAVTELAESLYLSIGETSGLLQVHVAVIARTGEDAQSMADIFQGAAALARLGAREAFGSEPGAASIFDILRALQVHVSGNTVTLDWSYDVQRLFADLRSLGESF